MKDIGILKENFLLNQGLFLCAVLHTLCSININARRIDFENVQYWSLGFVNMSICGYPRVLLCSQNVNFPFVLK